jgi:enamidase
MSDNVARGYLEDGFPQKLRSYLEAGVTTLRSTGDYWPEIVEARARVASGHFVGPRLEVVGPVFTAPGGHPTMMCRSGPRGGPHAEWCLSHLAVQVDDPREAREGVRRVAESGVDAIKMVGPQFGGLEDDAVIGALAEEAERRRIPALMHISDRDDAFHALSLGIDQFVHAPYVGSDTAYDRLMLDFMHQGDVFASSTISILDLSVEAGKLADLIVVDGNPLEDLSALRNVEVVAMGGEIVFPEGARH